MPKSNDNSQLKYWEVRWYVKWNKQCYNNWLVNSLNYTGHRSRFQTLCRPIIYEALSQIILLWLTVKLKKYRKDRNTNDDDKKKSDWEEEKYESENNEAAVSQPQKRKSKVSIWQFDIKLHHWQLYLLLLASVWRDFQKP